MLKAVLSVRPAVWLAAAGMMLGGCGKGKVTGGNAQGTNTERPTQHAQHLAGAKVLPPLPSAPAKNAVVRPARMETAAVFASLPPTRVWWLTWPDVWPVTPATWPSQWEYPTKGGWWVPTAYLISCRSNLKAPWVALASTGTNWFRIGPADQPEQYYKVEPVQ